LSLSIALSLIRPAPTQIQMGDIAWMISTAITELVTGFVLGIGVLLAFSACTFAGKILDVQIGFGIAQIFDPVTRNQGTVISAIFSQCALLLFFINDLHHVILRAFAASMERIPLGSSILNEQTFKMVMYQIPAMFSLGFILVAPIIIFMVMVEFAIGILSRNMPQMNSFVIGMPVKVVGGLVALSVWMLYCNELFKKVYVQMFHFWGMVF